MRVTGIETELYNIKNKKIILKSSYWFSYSVFFFFFFALLDFNICEKRVVRRVSILLATQGIGVQMCVVVALWASARLQISGSGCRVIFQTSTTDPPPTANSPPFSLLLSPRWHSNHRHHPDADRHQIFKITIPFSVLARWKSEACQIPVSFILQLEKHTNIIGILLYLYD